jgi:succinylglutamic semialdehyde dehydrogenase
LLVTGDAQPFVEKLVAMIAKIRVGLYTETPEPFMGPVITPAAADRLLAAQSALREHGGASIVEMKRLAASPALLSPGLIDVTDVRDRADEELFGPLVQLIRVRDLDAAIAEANNTAYGLAAGILTDDRAAFETFFAKIRAGVVNWNRPLTGASSALPFGGVGHSGNHRPSAAFAADYCSYPIASLESETVAMPAKLTPGIEL